jgi:hypothetical protein
MAATVKCAKGHWYLPDPSGKVSGCPRCLAASDPRKTISEDDVLAILSDSNGAGAASEDEPPPKLHKWSLKRHKKLCRACHCETSFSFDYCPRCGGPLEVAMIDVS